MRKPQVPQRLRDSASALTTTGLAHHSASAVVVVEAEEVVESPACANAAPEAVREAQDDCHCGGFIGSISNQSTTSSKITVFSRNRGHPREELLKCPA